MLVQQVIDQDVPGKTCYTLEPRPIGEGGTATIGRGVDAKSLADPAVAIKIAHPSSTPSEIEEFWAELEILGAIAKTSAGRNVPWAHRGYAPEMPELAILVMELVPDEWHLGRRARETGGRLLEPLAVETAIQYTSLLAVLDDLGITQRGDRKASDIRCEPSATRPRLIVLDWNRARQIPASATGALRQELVCQDIHGFARLWSQFMLGQRLEVLPAVDESGSAEWTGLTRAFRSILTRAWDAGTAGGYADALTLLKELEEHQKNLALVETGDPAAFIREAKELYWTVVGDEDPKRQAESAERILMLLDLAKRVRGAQLTDVTEIERLEAWGREFSSVLLRRTSEVVEQIKVQLNLQAYETAVQLSEGLLGNLEHVNLESLRAYQQLSRWHWVARSGVKGNDLRVNMEETIQRLTTLVGKVEEAAQRKDDPTFVLQAAERAREQMASSAPAEIQLLVRPLELELGLRLTANEIARAEAGGEPIQPAWGDIVRILWKELTVSQALFASSLRATIPALNSTLRRELVKSEMEGPQLLAQGQLDREVGRLEATLADFDAAAPVWTDLSDNLRNARQSFKVVLSQSGDPSEANRAVIDWLGWLDQLNPLMVQGKYNAALRVAGQPALPLVSETRCALAAGRCARIALGKLKTLEHEWSWPDELRDAQDLVKTIAAIGFLPTEVTREAEEIKPFLTAWEAVLEAKRTQLDLARDDNDFTQLLLDPRRDILVDDTQGNDTRDEILRGIAENLKIELFDRTCLPGMEDECRVERILAQRQMARLEARTSKLLTEITQLSRDVTKTAQSYPEQIQELEASLDHVKKALAEFEQTTRTLETTRFAGALADLQLHLGKIVPVVEQYKRLEQELPHLQQWTEALARAHQVLAKPPLEPARFKQQAEKTLAMARWVEKANNDALQQYGHAENVRKRLEPMLEELRRLSSSNDLERLSSLPIANVKSDEEIIALITRVLDERAGKPIDERMVTQIRKVIGDPGSARERSERSAFESKLKDVTNDWNKLAVELKNSALLNITQLLAAELEFMIQLTLPLVIGAPAGSSASAWRELNATLGTILVTIPVGDTEFIKQRAWLRKLREKVDALAGDVMQKQ